MSLIRNFSPGPAKIPQPVHQRIRAALHEDFGTLPLLEISHRSPAFINIIDESRYLLRQLLNIPSSYRILFLPSGATLQYAMVPLNLTADTEQSLDYLDSGHWSQRAQRQAKAYGQVHVVARLSADRPWRLPPTSQWDFCEHAAYCHCVDNETLLGFELPVGLVQSPSPLVADMTSNFLSRPFDVDRYGLVYASAQKNIGIAGLSIVIVDKCLLGTARAETPEVLNYAIQADAHSCFNTPPIFACYTVLQMLRWIDEQGGVASMHRNSVARAESLYQCIDQSSIYSNEVAVDYRSRMNVHFRIRPAELENVFLEQAEAEGFVGLRGHRAVGGLRASMYNAMDGDDVHALIDFMMHFEKHTG